MATLDNYSPEKKGSFFRALATQSILDAAVDFGFDKYFADKKSTRNAAYRVYLEVKSNPGKFGVSDELVKIVSDSFETRKVKRGKAELVAERPNLSPVDAKDVKGLLIAGRDKAAQLIHSKMDYLSAHPKKLQEENIVSLAKVFGIFFDKAQIIQGEATEHIAVLSKLDDNIKPEDAMMALLKMREKVIEEKFNKENK